MEKRNQDSRFSGFIFEFIYRPNDLNRDEAESWEGKLSVPTLEYCEGKLSVPTFESWEGKLSVPTLESWEGKISVSTLES